MISLLNDANGRPPWSATCVCHFQPLFPDAIG
jgi:hypothetical protein